MWNWLVGNNGTYLEPFGNLLTTYCHFEQHHGYFMWMLSIGKYLTLKMYFIIQFVYASSAVHFLSNTNLGPSSKIVFILGPFHNPMGSCVWTQPGPRNRNYGCGTKDILGNQRVGWTQKKSQRSKFTWFLRFLFSAVGGPKLISKTFFMPILLIGFAHTLLQMNILQPLRTAKVSFLFVGWSLGKFGNIIIMSSRGISPRQN